MYAMMVPSVGNLVLDYILIKVFDLGMLGAAWATTSAYILCFLTILWFFLSKNSELKLKREHFAFNWPIISEIGSLGFVTLSRQAVVSITILLMNNILFGFGGEVLVTAYAIVGRMLMFALFPVYGITQGFLPIAGYNYGAQKFERVEESIQTAIKYAAMLALLIFAVLMIFPDAIATMFTSEEEVIKETASAMRWVFAATPIIAIQLIGAAYFQAIGKAIPALLLTLTRQGFFFIPLIFILPIWYGELGVWLAFPVADFLATIVTAYFLNREVKLNLRSNL